MTQARALLPTDLRNLLAEFGSAEMVQRAHTTRINECIRRRRDVIFHWQWLHVCSEEQIRNLGLTAAQRQMMIDSAWAQIMSKGWEQ